jgi:hypothetical protein
MSDFDVACQTFMNNFCEEVVFKHFAQTQILAQMKQQLISQLSVNEEE